MHSAAKLFAILRQSSEKNPRSAQLIVFDYARDSDLVSLENCEMFLDYGFSFLQSGAKKWPIIDSVTLKLVWLGAETVNPLCSLWCVSRMSSLCHTSAVMVVFMALAVSVGAEQLEEKSCDVIGDESSESQTERALLKKLEPLSQMRYSTPHCRPWGCTVPTLSPRGGENLGSDCRMGFPISMDCDWLLASSVRCSEPCSF